MRCGRFRFRPGLGFGSLVRGWSRALVPSWAWLLSLALPRSWVHAWPRASILFWVLPQPSAHAFPRALIPSSASPRSLVRGCVSGFDSVFGLASVLGSCVTAGRDSVLGLASVFGSREVADFDSVRGAVSVFGSVRGLVSRFAARLGFGSIFGARVADAIGGGRFSLDYASAVEFAWPGGSFNRRTSMIHGSELAAVGARCGDVLLLDRSRAACAARARIVLARQ